MIYHVWSIQKIPLEGTPVTMVRGKKLDVPVFVIWRK